MNKNNNWLWWAFGGVALLGVGVGTYLYFKNKRAEDNPPKATEPPKPPVITPSGGTNETITNPFKNSDEVTAFQAWVNNTKGGSLVPDGKYGPKTDKEFQKYWKEYVAAVEAQNSPNLAEGWSKIKDQMLDKTVWGDNSKVDMEGDSRMRFGINIAGGEDAYVNFIPTGNFWIEIGKGTDKHGGTWTYKNGEYTLALNDGSWSMTSPKLSNAIKQVMKKKYPSQMQYYSFSEGKDNLDEVMSFSGKNYVDSQDSML